VNRGLITFIKNELPGNVKTRLAKDVGDTIALEIYRRLLSKTRHTASAVDAKRYLFYSEEIRLDDQWSEDLFTKHIQEGQDLGQKMSAAFQFCFEECTKAVIIGSDCPGLSPDYIHEAFELLDQCDIVFGPSTDGGYNLIGMNNLIPDIFESILWSTSEVLSQSKDIADRLSLSYSIMHPLTDVDHVEDLDNYPWLKEGLL
jgi:rSAM/selenodomain-associated transferase 1